MSSTSATIPMALVTMPATELNTCVNTGPKVLNSQLASGSITLSHRALMTVAIALIASPPTAIRSLNSGDR